ncbi:MAG: Rdx family protein [Proteobacteria bacterium]|nr:Rdx family protein [Pseudomonadota bacterium]
MARDLILKQHPSAKVSLHKTGGGVFEITVDGKLTFSKKSVGRFPTETEIAGAVSGA